MTIEFLDEDESVSTTPTQPSTRRIVFAGEEDVGPESVLPPEPEQPFFALEDAVSAIGTIPEALAVGVPAAFKRLVTGTAMPEESEVIERDIAFQERMQREQEDRQAAGKSSVVGEAIRGATPSLGFTVGSSGSAVAGGFLGLLGGPAAKVTVPAGIATASGIASYRMAASDLLYRSFRELEKSKGSPLTAEEKAKAYEVFLPLAQESGLWEAGPEAVSNVLLAGAGKFIFGFGKPVADRIVKDSIGRVTNQLGKKVAAGTGALAGELAGETTTAVGQFPAQAKAEQFIRTGTTEGAPTEYPGGVTQAFKDVAPSTIALTAGLGLVGGGAKLTTMPFQRQKSPEQIEEDNINLDAEREADNLLIPDNDAESKSIKAQIDSDRADLVVKKELYNSLPDGDKAKAVLATEIKEYEGRITELDNTLKQRLGLSETITPVEQRQIELARGLAEPAVVTEEAAVAVTPTEAQVAEAPAITPAPAAKPAPITPPPAAEAPAPEVALEPTAPQGKLPTIKIDGEDIELQMDPIVSEGNYEAFVSKTVFGPKNKVVVLPKGTKIKEYKTSDEAVDDVDAFTDEMAKKYGEDVVLKMVGSSETLTGGFADLPFETPLNREELIRYRTIMAGYNKISAQEDAAAKQQVLKKIPKDGPVQGKDLDDVVKMIQESAARTFPEEGTPPYQYFIEKIYNSLAHKAKLEGELLSLSEAEKVFAGQLRTPWTKDIPLAKRVRQQTIDVARAAFGVEQIAGVLPTVSPESEAPAVTPAPPVTEAPAITTAPAAVTAGAKPQRYALQQLGATSGEWRTIQILPNKEAADAEQAKLPEGATGWRIIPEPTPTKPAPSKLRGEAEAAPTIKRMAAPVRVEEKVQPVPEAERYTLEEAGIRAIDFFGGKAPDGLLIVNDTTNPNYEMKAGYDSETGEIIVNRAYIKKGESIEDILTHELGHYIYSDPKFQADFKRFLDSMPDDTRADIEAIINESYNEETGQTQIEERQVMAFTALVKASKETLSAWENLKNTIKRWINKIFGTNIKLSDEGAMAVFNVGFKRFKSGERIVRAMGEGTFKMAAEPRKPTPEKPAAKVEAEPMERGTLARMAITAFKTTPKGILAKTTKIIKDSVFNGDSEISDAATNRAWTLINNLVATNEKSVANAEAINQLTREAMTEVKAPEGATTEEAKTFEVVKQTVGMPKLRNELFKYAIKLTGQGDKRMLDFLLNNELNLAGSSIKTKEDIGRFLGALRGISSYIITATEAEQTGFFNIAAQQFFNTKNPTPEQVQQIKDIFNKVREVKIDQEKELMTELEDVGKAAGVDLPNIVQKELDTAPGLDPMVVAIQNLLRMGGTFTYRPTKNKIGEAVKRTITQGITNYRKKMVSKAATGLETGFWKTLASTEDKPGPLGELDAAQNRALGNIVKQSLVAMGLKGTPPDTKMTIYEQVASILGEQPLSKDKIEMADEKIRGGIEAKRQAELENASENQQDAINLKYDEMLIAWDDAMSRSLDMPVSDTMLRRLILNELKDTDSSIQEIAKLMDEEPAIGTSRQDRLVNGIIEKIVGSDRYVTWITAQGKPEADYTKLKNYLSDLLENMVRARQEKNKTAKSMAKVKRDASGDPDKQAQAQIDKLAKIQADPTIFGEKKIDPVRNAVRDALSLKLNIGFTPEQAADIKRNWKGAYVADPNKKGIPTSFMLEMQRLGVSEAAADTLAEIVWKQIEVNAMNRQMDATTKAVEAGPLAGMVQAILDTPLANQQDPEWRKKVFTDYLKKAGIKADRTDRIAELFDVSLRKRFAKAQEEAAIKAAKSIKGGLTTNSRRALEKFLKAIRAQVLDPGKDVAKAFGEIMGWKGFTPEQITRLNELDAIVNDNETSETERFVATEQIQQIIDQVSAPPSVKEVFSSFYVGNALGRFTTFAVQAFDPLAFTAFNTAVRSVRNVTNPSEFIAAWADLGRAVSNFARETAFSFKNDVLRSGRMIDYLDNQDRKIKRLWDEAERKWKRGDISGAMKDGLFGYTAWTFRTLRALDDGAYSLLTTTTLPQYAEAALKKAGIPANKRRGVMRQVLEAREIHIKELMDKGMSRNDATVYANELMQGALTKELSGLGIDSQEVVDSAINDALSRIGKTRFMEDVLTGKTDEIKDLGFFSSWFLRWYENVSKSVNQQGGSEAQKVFYRVLMGFPLIPARIFNIAAGYTPLTIYRHALKNRYSLTYGTALQRRQRLIEQMAGTMALLPLLLLRSNSMDEEEEKKKGFGIYITGQGPSRTKGRELHAQWNGAHKPFSLELKIGGKTKFAVDAKSSGPLSVMIYTLGALDDWELNRKIDGMKTTDDDWRDAQEKASIFSAIYDLAGYFALTTARRGPTTGVLQGLVDFRRYPDDPIAAIAAETSFSALPAVPILGTGIAKNLSDFFSQPIDNRTKEGAILSNIPIIGPVAGQPALNAYGQRMGELRFSEKLKKSFGVPFTLVTSDSEDNVKLTSLTLKQGDAPNQLRREDIENALQDAISDEEWRTAAEAYGKRNRERVLGQYETLFNMKPDKFAKKMTDFSAEAEKSAIKAVKDKRAQNP